MKDKLEGLRVIIPGACHECLEGQLGLLNRSYGQGHSLCSPLPRSVLDAIKDGIATTEFINGAWVVVGLG